MGGEQAAGVLATIAQEQRRREKKPVGFFTTPFSSRGYTSFF